MHLLRFSLFLCRRICIFCFVFRFRYSKGYSLSLEILSHIDSAGKENDKTLDYIKKVLINGEKIQADEDDLKKQNARHDTADLTRSANEGNAADNARRNGIRLVIQSRLRGGRAYSSAFNKA